MNQINEFQINGFLFVLLLNERMDQINGIKLMDQINESNFFSI